MKRREFTKSSLMLGMGLMAGPARGGQSGSDHQSEEYYDEPGKKLPARKFDVVVAGGGTAGVVAAIAAARQGANTVLIEMKGYPGGTVTEGGTTLHSFFNTWKPFPGVRKRQVVKGIPNEIMERLDKIGGWCGFGDMLVGHRDSTNTVIDTELYKLVTFEMLVEAGVYVCVNTLLVGAIRDGSRIRGVIAESRAGREVFYADSFVDCTAYGDLSSFAGAEYTEPNDYAVANSFGMGNVDIDEIYKYMADRNGIREHAVGQRSGVDGMTIRVQGNFTVMPDEFLEEAKGTGLQSATTTIHDNYLMFVKSNMILAVSPTDRDAVAKAELELRQKQLKVLHLFRNYFPGCEKAFIARTAPRLNIRRGRVIACDYDITNMDVMEARHFDDDVFVYSYHDLAGYQVRDGGTYGIPYRALLPRGIENLLVAGMLITSDTKAHQSTRNTVNCMGQGQAAGTAAALCALKNNGTRDLKYDDLRIALVKGGVYFEP
ncbi:MAG: FAD-dependent oxidoreductase [Bacteroidetes bacterium]|nr:FAD-dependent oxidoreductase [Bacteroidota bacterium]